MSIYVGEKKAVICKGDFEPAALYKGETKIAGYTEHEYQGTEIEAENTYRAELGLHVYGRSIQETTTGANLVNSTYDFNSQNWAKITIVNPDADFADREWQVNADVENGNDNTGIVFSANGITEDIKFEIGETYTASGYIRGNFNSKKPFRIIAFYTNTTGFEWGDLNVSDFKVPEQITEYTRYSMTFVIKENFDTNANRVTVAFSNLGGNYYFTKPMLQRGDKLTDYEPYTGGIPSPNPDYPQPINSIGDSGGVDVVVSGNNGNSQTLTINTPNGLCGIPVDTSGNYTDSAGQQWVCDEIDFERGVFVQRIGSLIIDTMSNNIGPLSPWDNKNLNILQPFRFNGLEIGFFTVLCNRLATDSESVWNRNTEIIGGVGTPPNLLMDFNILNERLGTTQDTSADDAKNAVLNWLKDNPLSCKYALVAPIETPLTAEELAAYKAIKSYPHYTHIQSEANMKVMLKEY